MCTISNLRTCGWQLVRASVYGLWRAALVSACTRCYTRRVPDDAQHKLDGVQKVGFEIAGLGMNGLDVNDPTPKYRLRTLPGEFSGLQLVSIQYVAFKQFAPDQDIGFDPSNEYRMALEMYERRSGDG